MKLLNAVSLMTLCAGLGAIAPAAAAGLGQHRVVPIEPIVVAAQDQRDETGAVSLTRAELKERFERRFRQVEKLKQQGRVGETWQGFLDPVSGDSPLPEGARALVDQENADRKRLYQLIADDVVKGQKRVTEQVVAERNARRNFANAKPDEALKIKADTWIRRADVKALRKSGKAGETWEGTVEAVPQAKLSASERTLVDAENAIRAEIYRRDAAEADRTPQEMARDAGKANLAKAAAGEHVKTKDGWSKADERVQGARTVDGYHWA